MRMSHSDEERLKYHLVDGTWANVITPSRARGIAIASLRMP